MRVHVILKLHGGRHGATVLSAFSSRDRAEDARQTYREAARARGERVRGERN